MPSIKASGGRTYSKTCLIRGREPEGRKAILVRARDNTRVAPIGPDGLTLDGSEKVPTSDLVDVQPVADSRPVDDLPIPGVMSERGAITIPSEYRRRLRLRAGSPVLIEIRGDSILIQPAEVRPRSAASLDELLSRVTSENIHTETSTGDAVGREAW